MNDINFMKVDDALYNLLINAFDLDLEDETNLSKYHQFRNDVIDLIDELKERKIMNIDENDNLNILNDLKATNDHELEILEKLDDICIGTLSDMIIRSLQRR
jgi:hypothetical protein